MTDQDRIEKLIKGDLSLNSLTEEEKDDVLLYICPRISFIQGSLEELTKLREDVFASSPKLKEEWNGCDNDDPDGNLNENDSTVYDDSLVTS